MEGLNFAERKGDITFYSDIKGNLYQQIGSTEPFAVKEGICTYRPISVKKNIEVKYHNNGTRGFSLFRNGRLLKDNIWIQSEANRIADEINDRINLLSAKPNSYRCAMCEQTFPKLKDRACPHCGSANYIPEFTYKF